MSEYLQRDGDGRNRWPEWEAAAAWALESGLRLSEESLVRLAERVSAYRVAVQLEAATQMPSCPNRDTHQCAHCNMEYWPAGKPPPLQPGQTRWACDACGFETIADIGSPKALLGV